VRVLVRASYSTTAPLEKAFIRSVTTPAIILGWKTLVLAARQFRVRQPPPDIAPLRL